MTIQGFQIVFSGWNFNPSRNEVTSMLKREIESHAEGWKEDWEKLSFKEKCHKVALMKGANAFHVDAVRGTYLGWS